MKILLQAQLKVCVGLHFEYDDTEIEPIRPKFIWAEQENYTKRPMTVRIGGHNAQHIGYKPTYNM